MNKIILLNIILGFISLPLFSQEYFDSTGSIEILYKKGNRTDTLKRPVVKSTRIEELVVLYLPIQKETNGRYYIIIRNEEGEILRIPESKEFLINGNNKLVTQEGSIIETGKFQFQIEPHDNNKWPQGTYVIEIYSKEKMVFKRIFLIS